MKAYILKEKETNKFWTFHLSWSKSFNLKSVKYEKCFHTRQMAERFLSQISDKWKDKLYIVQVEIEENKGV